MDANTRAHTHTTRDFWVNFVNIVASVAINVVIVGAFFWFACRIFLFLAQLFNMRLRNFDWNVNAMRNIHTHARTNSAQYLYISKDDDDDDDNNDDHWLEMWNSQCYKTFTKQYVHINCVWVCV